MLDDGSRPRLRQDPPEGSPPAASPLRFPFLDGLRGLTALYVVLHHAAAELDKEKVVWPVLKWMLPFRFGHYAVAIFIVLSGFCIALPIVREPGLALRGGLLGYLKRRARRILPPYYAALVIILALLAIFPILRTPITQRWEFAINPFTWGMVVSHFFLLHDVKSLWTLGIDPPMWSVAVEWQIYLLFPILLLVWRRFGIGAMLASAFVIGNVDRAFGQGYFQWGCPWYVFLFALGAAAARSAVAPGRSRYWTIAACVVLAVACDQINRHTEMTRRNDLMFGLGTACALVAFARISREGGYLRVALREILESPISLFFGHFSYSIYLVHFPILSVLHAWMLYGDWTQGQRLAGLLTGGSFVAVLAAYAFHLCFEKPTLSRPTKAATTVPAPTQIPQRRGLRNQSSRSALR